MTTETLPSPLANNPRFIHPSVLLPDGTTVYPSGLDWLMGFALAGCEWAVKALPVAIEKARLEQCETYNGGCI